MVLPTIALEPADGLVFIRSNPTAASVTIGGTFQGQTPLEVALAPAEDHQITFLKTAMSRRRQRCALSPTRRAR